VEAPVWDPSSTTGSYQIIFRNRNGTRGAEVSLRIQGDNLFLSSLVAVDADTGEYKWHYQETPSDEWDYDSAQGIILTQLQINGVQRQVLLHAPKKWFFSM